MIYFVLIVIGILAFLVYASVSINSQIYLKSICKGEISNNKIAITFDDGPDADITPKILAALAKTNTKASFFVIGKNIDGNESILKQIVDDGHILGNHSFEHGFGYDFKNAKELIVDIRLTQLIIEKITGYKTLLFRPPYGISTPGMGKAVKELNLTTIGWSLRSMDTTLKNKDQLFKKVSKIKGGDIVLFHDTTPFMAEFLIDWIQLCKRQGLEIVSLDELIPIRKYA